MRIVSWAAFLVLAMAGAAPAFANPQAFEDNKLHLKTCDGKDVTVRWLGDDFNIALFGKAIGAPQNSLQFLGWDGNCQNVTWDKKAESFALGEGDAAKPIPFLKYVAEDDSKWIGTRNGDGFFVTLIAKPGETVSNARIAEIADWLKRTSHEFTPGEALAKQLSVANAD
jgi:hypothetical protein